MEERQGLPAIARPSQWRMHIAAILVASIATVAAVLQVRADAVHDAKVRNERRATSAVQAMVRVIDDVATQLVGSAAVIADDGSLRRDVFDAFAVEALRSGDPAGLLLVDRVATLNGTAEGPDRFPVIAAAGTDVTLEVATPIIGRDLAADRQRGPALRQAATHGQWVVTGPLPLLTTGERGVAIVRPATRSTLMGDRTIFVVSGVPLARLQAAAEERVNGPVVVDGLEGTVFGAPFPPRTAISSVPVRLGELNWSLRIEASIKPDHRVTLLTASTGAGGVLFLAALGILTLVHQRRLGSANERLVREEGRSNAVRDLAGQLARALTAHEVRTALISRLPAAVGAGKAAVVFPRGPGEWVVAEDASTGVATRPIPQPAERSILGRAMAADDIELFSSRLGWRGDTAVEDLVAGAGALVILPMATGQDDGSTSGVVAVCYPTVHVFDDDERELLETIRVLVSRALERGRQHDVDHMAALAFQRSALPANLPSPTGLRIATRYLPAESSVGGDWFDAVERPDGSVVVAIGDVVGHGLSAAASMSQLRMAFQVIAAQTNDPGAMVRTLDSQSGRIRGAEASTVICAAFDRQRQTLAWCRAGHPPPLIIRDRVARYMEQSGNPPLGLGTTSWSAATVPLDAGDTVVFYTDGLVERSGEHIDDGLHRLQITAAELSDLAPSDFVDALLQAVAPTPGSDDVALLVVQCRDRAESDDCVASSLGTEQ